MKTYDQFRTGLDFATVRQMVVQESVERYAREGQCIRPTRSRVLGKWHELKRTQYRQYLRESS